MGGNGNPADDSPLHVMDQKGLSRIEVDTRKVQFF